MSYFMASKFKGNLALCKGRESVMFAPLLEDLKILERGYSQDGHLVKAAMNTFLADGLEAHLLMGLQQSFSRGFICRHCIGMLY